MMLLGRMVGAIIAIAFFVGTCFVGVAIVDNGVGASNFLAVAGVIISAATLSSVVFGVLTYAESVILKESVASAKLEIDEAINSVRSEVASYEVRSRELTEQNLKACYAGSLIAVEAIFDLVFAGASPAMFQSLYKRLKLAEAEIHLHSGDVNGVKAAAEIFFKYDKSRLFDLAAKHLRPHVSPNADVSAEAEWAKVEEYLLRLLQRVASP